MKLALLDRSACLRRLGLDETVKAPGIRRAYRRLALAHHPDRNAGSEKSLRRFIEIGEAYRELMRQETERAKAAHRPQTVTPAEMAIAMGWNPAEADDSPPVPAARRRGRGRRALPGLLAAISAVALTMWATSRREMNAAGPVMEPPAVSRENTSTGTSSPPPAGTSSSTGALSPPRLRELVWRGLPGEPRVESFTFLLDSIKHRSRARDMFDLTITPPASRALWFEGDDSGFDGTAGPATRNDDLWGSVVKEWRSR